MKTLLGSLLLPLPLLLAACSDTPSPPVDSAEPPPVDTAEAQAAEATEPPAAQRLEASELGSTTPVHAFGDVLLAGQPGTDDLALARERGVVAVIDLRLPAESRPFDEPARLAELGMVYHNPGFGSPEQLTDELFDEVRTVLRDEESRPVLLHCASANRVGAVWLAHRVLDDGVSFEEALPEAQQVGLRSPALLEAARSYVERMQAE